MKKIIFTISIIIFSLFLHTACKRSSSSSLSYDPADATVRAFAFAKNDTMPGLGAASFTVEQRSDTGLIGMADGDSILFGTSLKRVIPLLTYNGIPSAAICYLGDTSMVLTGYDTLDFTRTPIKLRVFAADRKHEKWYYVEPHIHTVDPDVYSWQCLTDAAFPPQSAEQQVIDDGQRFLYFTNNGVTTSLAVSEDGADWTQETVTGLPANCRVKQICFDNKRHTYFYLDATRCYSSADGLSWSSAEYADSDIRCLAGELFFCGRLWAFVYQPSADTYWLAAYNAEEASFDLHKTVAVSDFSVSDYAVVLYRNAGGREYALVAGGYTHDGTMTGAGWAFEETADGCRVVRLHGKDDAPAPFAGRAIVKYGNRLIAVGGINADNEWLTTPLVSDNEGMSWKEYTDTLHPILPDSYGLRRRLTALTKDNDLYLFGGQSLSDFHTDVYKGRLASIDW